MSFNGGVSTIGVIVTITVVVDGQKLKKLYSEDAQKTLWFQFSRAIVTGNLLFVFSSWIRHVRDGIMHGCNNGESAENADSFGSSNACSIPMYSSRSTPNIRRLHLTHAT